MGTTTMPKNSTTPLHSIPLDSTLANHLPIGLICRIHISNCIIMGIPTLMGQLNKHNSGTKESMVFSCIVLEALFQCLKALESPVHGLMPAAKGGHGPLVLTVNAIVRSPAIFIPLVASISHDLFKWLKHLLQLVYLGLSLERDHISKLYLQS